jgi:hypothetical protein
VRDRGLAVFMAHPTTCAPALDRLESLLGERLGPARLVLVEQTLSGRPGGDLLRAAPLLPLLARCAAVIGMKPGSVWAFTAEAGLGTVVLEGDGRAVQVGLRTGTAVGAACRVEVVAEKGAAAAELPRRVCWRDGGGVHAQRLPCRPAEEVLLERFADGLRDGRPPRPNFDDACAALALLRAAWRSREEGRQVPA